MLLAAMVAALIITHASATVQKKWRLHHVFIGKKHAYLVHVLLLVFVWLEVLAVTFFVRLSTWSFFALWVLGIPVCFVAAYGVVRALKRYGIHRYLYIHYFNERTSQNTHLRRADYELYGSLGLFYAGLAITFGKYGYLLGVLGIGMVLCASRLQHRTTKTPPKH